MLVALESAGDTAALEALGKQLAMHIAAANPLALRGEELDPALIERERAIAQEKAAETGKPADIVAKMVEGAMAKFRKENALLSQLFVIDNKTKVEDVVAAAGKDAGAPVTLKAYVRFQLGEGIEKKESDFAAEVAAAAGTPKAEPPGRSRGLGTAKSWQGIARAPSQSKRLRTAPPGLQCARHVPTRRTDIPMPRPRFNRILLKLSGEALMGEGRSASIPAPSTASPARSRRRRQPATHSAWWSAAATSSAASPARPAASTAPPPIIWACWRR